MEIQPLDIAAAGIIAAASLRGLFNGLLREGFSLASLACAYLAVQLFTLPAAAWLQQVSSGGVSATMAPWVAGVGVAIATITIVTFIGRALRRSAHAAGLSWADRLAGGVLGVAEGALVAGILLMLGTEVLGRDHAAFRETKSLALLERVEQAYVESGVQIDVAAPPRLF